ncbi:MAG: hotdog fold thioesterase [Alphaproteobacteria bacterium]|nr:hotdog fold thioesterase [Alphaproteobacteria bacterium]
MARSALVASSDIEALFERVLSPGGRTLGTALVDYDAAERVVTLAFVAQPEFTNILGAVHGGYVAAMLDETAGMAAKLSLPLDKAVPTLDFNTTFLAPAPTGRLLGRGRVLRLGRRTAFMEALLTTEEEKVLARMTVTALVTDVG